jgi:hypothetical protein
MNKLFFSVLLISFLFMSCSSKNFEQRVKSSVKIQLEQYPLLTLQDLYKSFFQDKFGPGHLINDTSAAQRYLDSELMSFETSVNPKVEPTGWEHNFYRINLSVLKDSTIPYDAFFAAFIESTNNIATPSIEEWKKEWASIEEIISSMNLSLPSYNTDKKTIDSLLDAGKYVMHHSQAYNDAYQPHYRIVSRNVFEGDLQQYLDK